MPTSLKATALLQAITAAGEDPILSLEDAITTAYEWHPGGGSALYSFASNKGKLAPDMFPRLSQEIQEAKNWVQGNAKPLDSGSYPEYADDASRAAKVGLSTSQWLLRRLDNVVEQAKNATKAHAEVITSSAKEAGFGEDSIRSLVYFARSNKQRLTDILRDQGPNAVVEELKALPGMENAGARVAPAFVQWLSGQLHDSGLVGILEKVFTKQASLENEEALHMVSGSLVIAGLHPSEVQAQGTKVRIAGLRVNSHVIKHISLIAAEYGLQLKLDSDFNKPGEQPEVYPEPVRHEPEGINRTATSPEDHQKRICIDTVRNPNKGKFMGGPSAEEAEETLRTKFHYNDEQIKRLKTAAPIPSAAGNHAGAGNPVNPTGDAPAPVPQDEEEEEEQPPQVPLVPVKPHTSYGQGVEGEVYGQRKAAAEDPMNGEGEVKVNVRRRGESILSGNNQMFPDRKAALAFVEQSKQNPEAEIISMSILWGGQWSLTNEWTRDPEPMGDGAPAVEWDEQASAGIYRTASEEGFEEESVECPACGGDGIPLGALGNLQHFRCQDCGSQFSHKTAADDSLTGTLAEIETMLSSVQELADKAVAKARLQSNPDLSANVERMNVKIYESLVAARTAKVDAQGSAAPETPTPSKENLAPVTATDKQAIGPWGGQGHFVRQNQDAHPVKAPDVKNPGAELSYNEKEQLLNDMKGPKAPEPEDKDPRYGYKLPLTSSLTLASEQMSKGPDASQGDTKDNAIEFINANGSAMDDYTVQQLREALTSAGYTQPVADSAITELLGQEALLALATPVKELLEK